MTRYEDVFYKSADGLRLHARDYNSAPAGQVPILCMAGLTRNARDFEGVADRLSARHRIIVAEQRGRGDSQWDPSPENYNPAAYVGDMVALLDHLGIAKVATIGTSLGGIMSMAMAAGQPDRIAGILLNDVGPELAVTGLDKIKTYIDRAPRVSNWQEAAADIRALFGASFPRYGDAEWARFARRVYREDAAGIPVLDYDPGIAVNVKTGGAAPDLWPLFDAVPMIPIAVVRGEISDLFLPATLAEMRKRRPGILVAEVPAAGHAPSLEEPEAVALIDLYCAALTP